MNCNQERPLYRNQKLNLPHVVACCTSDGCLDLWMISYIIWCLYIATADIFYLAGTSHKYYLEQEAAQCMFQRRKSEEKEEEEEGEGEGQGEEVEEEEEECLG